MTTELVDGGSQPSIPRTQKKCPSWPGVMWYAPQVNTSPLKTEEVLLITTLVPEYFSRFLSLPSLPQINQGQSFSEPSYLS